MKSAVGLPLWPGDLGHQTRHFSDPTLLRHDIKITVSCQLRRILGSLEGNHGGGTDFFKESVALSILSNFC